MAVNTNVRKQVKIGYLILCHKDPALVKRLINRLILHKNFYCFVHVDAKSNFSEFYVDDEKVEYVADRIDISWGSYEAIIATNKLIHMALDRGMGRLVLNQGLDYPIMTNERINQFFQKNRDIEFIHACKISGTHIKTLRQKVTINWHMDNLTLLNRIIRKFALITGFETQRDIIALNRKTLSVYYGSATWAITRSSAEKIVDFEKNKRFQKYMKKVFAPDEEYYQTILHNSSSIEKSQLLDEKPSPLLIDFKNLTEYRYPNGVTGIYAWDDLSELRASGRLFARKTASDVSKKLLDWLDEENLKEEIRE